MKAKQLVIEKSELTISGEAALPADIFGLEDNAALLSRAVTWQLHKRRSGCHKTKTRSEVSLSGSKPFRQKGTGRARQGTSKAPHMRKGGTAFGPVVRSHAVDLPKKQRKLAVRVALSGKARGNAVFLAEKLSLENISTKTLSGLLSSNDLSSALFVSGGEQDKNFLLSARNIPAVKCLDIAGLNVYDILYYKNIIFTADALSALNAGEK